ncbi:MAG: hypothetical protein ABEJ85_03085 [Haloarculaceae archaeon]
MVLPSSPFGGDDEQFDAYDAFVPEHVPAPGPALDGHDVLTGRRHVAFHRLTRALFEERAVYDMTFNYNLARLNLDARHESAGYRYAEERPGAVDDADEAAVESGRVLRAEFTPTTPFCPQTHTLTKGSFRAWNGLSGRHEYALVRVRVAPMHHEATAINAELAGLERQYVESGSVPTPDGADGDDGEPSLDDDALDGDVPGENLGRGPSAPF